LPTQANLDPSRRAAMLEAMRHDKKVAEGEIKFVLANKVGQVSFGQRVPLELIEAVLAGDPLPSVRKPSNH
jgi:3-dehydroquinate synthetase